MFDFEDIEKELAELSLAQKSRFMCETNSFELEYQMLEDIECCTRKEMKL